MGRDQAKDNQRFNCNDEREMKYIASLYPQQARDVLDFLIEKRESYQISKSTYQEVYCLIEDELGLPKPV